MKAARNSRWHRRSEAGRRRGGGITGKVAPDAYFLYEIFGAHPHPQRQRQPPERSSRAVVTPERGRARQTNYCLCQCKTGSNSQAREGRHKIHILLLCCTDRYSKGMRALIHESGHEYVDQYQYQYQHH